ncbi:MAG: hypothetical protein AB7F99_16830 [Vicinamibacterales bacterium]
MLDLTVVRVFLNTYEAEVARGALQASGIESWIRSDDAGGLHPGMWVARGVQLAVRSEDADRAEIALNSYSGPMDLDL